MVKVKQVNLYNLNTRDFYTKEERDERDKFNTLEFYTKNLNYYESKVKYHQAKNNLKKVENYSKKIDELNARKKILDNLQPCLDAKHYKTKVRTLVKGNTTKRTFNSEIDKLKIVSTFTSTFTRAIGIEEDKLDNRVLSFTDNIIVVSVTKDVDEHIQNDIMSQLITYGFTFNNKNYTYAFSGAGQIRTKKLVFVNEVAYQKAQDKLYAGLTDEIINEKGGVVAGKLLAYKALNASASVEWKSYVGKELKIDECIVVKDFDHIIKDVEVEPIDWDYKIGDVVTKDISNPFMDGSGIMLESVYNKNVQFRAPWMKGLLSPFAFDEFIKLHNIDLDTFEVEDAWGNPQLLKGIKVIFTESQFKMRKYFDSWKSYKDAFKKHKCEFAICNEESLDVEDFKDCTVSYQMLQTLHNMSDDEIKDITSFARDKINSINNATKEWYTKDEEGNVHINEESKGILLDVLGIDTDFTYKRPFTSAIQLASDKLLFDKYVQQSIFKTRDAMIKDAKSGKLLMEGSRTVYMLPDFYAFCERLFLNEENPKGLLEANEVSCALYDDKVRLDLLRSPHLYKEHCIHTNKRSNILSDWFKTNGVHVSVNSTASHQLAADWDGDTSLLVPEIEDYKSSYTFVQVAKRHMENVYVLDYEMSKGTPIELNNKSIISALKKSFKANIGTISNQITKILNKSIVTDEDLKLVKLLKMKNNFVIDYAKTNFDPKIKDKDLKEQFKEIKSMGLPYFFKFAKDKKHKSEDKLKEGEKNQVVESNNSVMNRICESFKDFDEAQFARDGEFDSTILVFDKDVDIKCEKSKLIIDTYESFVNDKVNTTQMKQEIESFDDSILKYYVKASKVTELEEKLMNVEKSKRVIADVLIKHLYRKFYIENKNEVTGKVSRKRIYNNRNLHMIWEAFGDIILDNLKLNLGIIEKGKACANCEIIFEYKGNRQKYCSSCRAKHNRKQAAERKRKQRISKSQAKVAS